MTRIIHPPFDGENLTKEREALGGPCPIHPNDFLQLVIATGFISSVWLAICIADWSMSV